MLRLVLALRKFQRYLFFFKETVLFIYVLIVPKRIDVIIVIND